MSVVVAAAGLIAGVTFGFGSTARADSPSAQGWWTSANPGSGAGGPSAPTGSPAPPDVPSNGLLVEGGPTSAAGAGDSGATAYSALVYDVPGGASVGNLTLAVAPNSATTPSATLELCPLTTQNFQPEEGGPMSDAPSYDCTINVTAAQSSNSYQFNVSSLVSSGSLAVAILPTSPTDRVVLSQPDTTSLQVQGSTDTTTTPTAGNGSSPGDFGPTAGTDTGSSIGAGSTGATPAISTGLAAPAPGSSISPALALPTPAQPRSTAAPTTAAVNTALAASSTSSSGPRPWVGVIFLLLLLLAGALWMGAGRSAAGTSATASQGAEGAKPVQASRAS